jgi:hypothetical protein
MRIHRAVIILLFLFVSCSGGGGGGDSGGSSGSNPPPGSGNTFFVATFVQGNNSVDYSPLSVNTLIGFAQVSIFTFNIQGETFDMFFERPDEVPIEINLLEDPFAPKGGASITFGLNSFIYDSGTVFITQMTNERVAGDFDFLATSQIDGSVIQVIGSFNLPDGILAFQ